ncbi:6-carboxy-5,6,7,8-tetrahydropterin synthase [Chlamydiales bacterium STE3]|nr:6-carboxy-5,6,7,8-tetrahydropterin synthase [Chlamydiales bacterium STE3]
MRNFLTKKICCVRKLHFCAGHRVMGHEGKCATVHGHNYYLHLFAESPKLDAIGRVVDFSVLKEKIGSWVEYHWDHNFLVCDRDDKVIEMLHTIPRKKDPFICPFNPTAENMAYFLLHEIAPQCLKGTSITITKIVLYETENCYVEVSL